MADEDRAADELDERRQHGLDAWRRRTIASVMPGEHGDGRRDGAARVDEGVERPQALAAPELDGADLGDRVLGGEPPVVSRSTTQNVTSASGVSEVVERALHGRAA